jgi:GTP cyclohydrolase I
VQPGDGVVLHRAARPQLAQPAPGRGIQDVEERLGLEVGHGGEGSGGDHVCSSVAAVIDLTSVGKESGGCDACTSMTPADPARVLPARRLELAPSPVDLPRAQAAVSELLAALGVDVEADGLHDTPRRVAAAYAELLTPKPFNPTTFPNDEGYDELVVARDIPFHSLCEHHLLPFSGVAHVAYLPGDRILGLSKLARVVELYARRLQVQERLTMQVARWIEAELQPRGVGVVMEAEHLCMTVRGVQKPGTTTVTSALLGMVRDDTRTRTEFLTLVRRDRT